MDKKLNRIAENALKEKDAARSIKKKKEKNVMYNIKRTQIASEVKKCLAELEEGCVESAKNGKFAYPIVYDMDDPGGGSGDFWTPGNSRRVDYKDAIIKKIKEALKDSDYNLIELIWYTYDTYSGADIKYDGLCAVWGTEEQISKSLNS